MSESSDPERQALTDVVHDQEQGAAANPPGTGKRAAVRYVVTLGAILSLLYAVAYHPWQAGSFGGRLLNTYLEWVAVASAKALELFGEQVWIAGSSVSGRFSYVVVVDCAALDVQAMFVAAVLAFPSRWSAKWIGLAGGLAAIFAINIGRLVALYFAGAHSTNLFKTLHEEVFVLLIVALVCGLFLTWATWAKGRVRHALDSVPEAA